MHTNYNKIIQILILSLLIIPGIASSHNNPKFINKLLSTVEVKPTSGKSSEEFKVDAPKETVRIVWNVESDNKENITFSIKQGEETIAKDLRDGSESLLDLISGKNLIVADVSGTDSEFKLNISARVIEEKKKNALSKTASAGKRVYKKANCIGCHKWHGDGGGGYGGAALSLKTTKLNAEGLKYIVRCGRPATGMPYHGREAFKGDDKSCYNKTGKELGENIPPRARKLLSERELDAVVDYVVQVIQGSGKPDLEQCVAFWGEKSRQCDAFRKK